MTPKPSFFDRTVTIRTHQDMVKRLAERTNKSFDPDTGQVYGTGSSAPAGDASDSGRVGDGQTNVGVAPTRTQPEPTPSEAAIPPVLTERPAALQWGDVVRTGPATAFQLSIGGQFSVVRLAPGVFEVWDRRVPPFKQIAVQLPSGEAARNAAQNVHSGEAP